MSFALRKIRFTRLRDPSFTSRFYQAVVTPRTLSIKAIDPGASASLELAQISARLSSPSISRLDIRDYYPVLAAKLRNNSGETNLAPAITESQVIIMLEILAKSGMPQDLNMIIAILHDTSTLFQIQPTIDMHTAVIRGLIQNGKARSVYNWLCRMHFLPGNFTPTIKQFHMFLEASTKMESYKYTYNLILEMQSLGCKPTTETFAIAIRDSMESALAGHETPRASYFKPIVEDMKRLGLPYDVKISNMFYDFFVSIKQEEAATKICDIYKRSLLDPTYKLHAQWSSELIELSNAALRWGVLCAIYQFKNSKTIKSRPEPVALAILRYSTTCYDLMMVEKELQIKCDAGHWAILILNNIRGGHLTNALDIYRQSKEAGITPTTGLVVPIIVKLCQSTSDRPPSEASIDCALELYRDLANACPPEVQNHEIRNNGPDENIYDNLLRALATTKHDKYSPVFTSLTNDMKLRNISTTSTTASLIMFLIRRASTPQEALEAYRQYASSSPSSSSSRLDKKLCSWILNTFTDIFFNGETPTVALPEYFIIVKDMDRAGIHITVYAYTILLRRLATVGTQLRRQANYYEHLGALNGLIEATRRTHDLLTVDASTTPDTTLLTQLMDTYQRLDCFPDAYRVWDMMYISGMFNQVSISVILDACAYANALPLATQIFNNLRRDHFVLDLHNWNTWLECLCRLGRLSEAFRTLCMDMGKKRDIPPPDVESVRIVMKFARQLGKGYVAVARLQEHLPDLWKELPSDVKDPSRRKVVHE